ncbi:MAG: amidohydrolase [Thermomicrobiales bacterium]|nr:amidohydrolase [Thermomicrobiales bacterium]
MPVLPQAPDLILLGGRVHTLDPTIGGASALAVKDGRIAAVGADEEIRSLAGASTQIVALDGATVIPGLIDPHNHLLMTGAMLAETSLYDCRSIPEIVERVAERVRRTPPGNWVVGRGWDESLLAERRHPTRHDLDAVAPDHPVVLHRVWNKLVCNSAALRAAGITAATPDPPADLLYGGSFDRDASGEPTGLFRDRAKELIAGAVPPPTESDMVEAIAAACAAYHAVGITGIAEPGLYPEQIHAYGRARREERLTVRADLLLAGWGFGTPEIEPLLQDRFAGLGLEGGLGDDRLRLEGIKLMPDGGISDRTARMYDPYLDEPGNHGTWTVEPERLVELIRWVHDLGWPMDIHTCGDEAQAVVVRAYADAQHANPKPWLRHRVHHAYFPTPETLRLMAEFRIPALVSSPFLRNLGEGFVNSVGPERAARAMPMRTYLNAGVIVAGSSDSPITDYNPWVGMATAVERRTVTGRLLGPDEVLTPMEALRSYTTSATFATGRETRQGMLTPGKLADLVVLDRDPLAAPDELAAVRPVATMVGGAWVFGGV